VNSTKITKLLFSLWNIFTLKRRQHIVALLAMMVAASFAEILSIGALLPFLSVITVPEKILANPLSRLISDTLGITQPSELLLPVTLIFGAAVLFAGVVRLTLSWATTRITFSAGAELSIEIYRRTLYQPYATHVARNSSEIIAGISSKTNDLIYNIMMPALNLINACFMLLAVLIVLIIVNASIAISAIAGFGLIYFIVIKLTRHRLAVNSNVISRDSVLVFKCLQEGLGGIRDVLIDGTQETYSETYSKADFTLRRAQGNNLFIALSPRYVVETIGMLLIAGLAFSIANNDAGINSAIPVLGALALGAQRLLPVLQQAYAGWTSILGSKGILMDVLNLLHQPLPDFKKLSSEPINYSKEIVLKNISFRYGSDLPLVLHDINLSIPKGSRIGFIGTTGSGKSTLIDIVMSLLDPSTGELIVDDKKICLDNKKKWQEKIAHVPQTIFLADTTIEENIAFGVPGSQINHDLVRESARKAQLSETIENWPRAYLTRVGERGIQLSGGQRQRIGIARALYKKAEVIVFDEATSALDGETELAVMKAIESLDRTLTLLIVAHRISTLSSCDLIVELHEGRVHRMCSYQDILKNKA
jgi:ATP-binding cassette subfamily B protein